MESGDGVAFKRECEILCPGEGERGKHKIFPIRYHNERNTSTFSQNFTILQILQAYHFVVWRT